MAIGPEPLPAAAKAALAAEILACYVVARWRMPRREIRDVVTACRAPLARASRTGRTPGADEGLVAARLGHTVTRTLRALPTDNRCLVQALVLSRLLARRGIPSRLVIGAHTEPQFTAHAWVEYEGRPVLPTQGYRDSRLVEL